MIQLIFWGSYWNSDQGKLDKTRDQALATSLSSGPYFSGLEPYIGSTPKFGVSSNPVVDLSSTAPTTTISDDAMIADIFGEFWNLIGTNQLAPPQFGSNTPIYVVVTPPGARDETSIGLANGWNRTSAGFVPIIWCFDPWSKDGSAGSLSDQFSDVLGHELAEMMTDPLQDDSGVEATSGGEVDQICDFEAVNLSYRLGGPTGYLVQSHWSQTNNAYIIPDGNSYQFTVTGGTQQPFTEGTGETLTIDGGQAGAAANDAITVGSTASGAITATLDGQTVSFDPGAISNVIVNATSASTTVNVDGTWEAGTGLTINVANNPTTIDVSPDARSITGNFAGSITVSDPNKKSVLNLDIVSVLEKAL
ncbi:MAG: hypothetical protein ACLQGP_36390 [Isosphaeraceae bacterium]